MADPVHSAPGDDLLAAYIDGELDDEARKAVDAALADDPATRARLEALQASNRPYKDAFQLVLDAAPRDRLAASLGQVVPPRATAPPPRRVWMSAAALVLFASGIAIGIATDRARTPASPATAIVAQNQAPVPSAAGARQQAPVGQVAGRSAPIAPELRADAPLARGAPGLTETTTAKSAADTLAAAQPPLAIGVPASPATSNTAAPAASAALAPPPPSAVTWRQIVADYAMLTTADTLAVMPDNPRLGDAVSTYGNRVQLDLTADKLQVPMASLKDVRLYDYRGRPLLEASYLSDDGTAVVTLCILLNGAADAPLAFEQRNGQNIVFWASGGRGFMIVGRAPREVLEQVARDIAPRLS